MARDSWAMTVWAWIEEPVRKLRTKTDDTMSLRGSLRGTGVMGQMENDRAAELQGDAGLRR